MAIELNSGDIFVSDSKNHRVQVFNSKGEYLYKFGDQAGYGKWTKPSVFPFLKREYLLDRELIVC